MGPIRLGSTEGSALESGMDFASVSDESSPDARLTGRTKVAINAQVLTDQPLDWFRDLRSHFAHIVGEIKGKVVVALLESLPAELQRRVQAGLSRAHIYITDPRPYVAEYEAILQSEGIPFVAAAMEASVRAGDRSAQSASQAFARGVAFLILCDSRPAQLARRVAALSRFSLVNRLRFRMNPLGLDVKAEIDEISARRQSVVTRAALYAAKSGSIFSGPLDVRLRRPRRRTWPVEWSRPILERIASELRAIHAFDEGDARLIDRLETVRDEIGTSIERVINPFAGLEPFALEMVAGRRFAPPIPTVVSSHVDVAQAADIAARVAATLYERVGPSGVVTYFDYVVINGTRVSAGTIHEHVGSWRFPRGP